MKKLNNGFVKSVAVVFCIVSLMTIACKQDDKSQPDQSAVEAKESKPDPTSGSVTSRGIPPVTGLSAKASGRNVINLSWNSVPNATTYWIYRDTYVPAIVKSTSYTDKSLKAGITYTYAIAAIVNGTLGPKSPPVPVTTAR